MNPITRAVRVFRRVVHSGLRRSIRDTQFVSADPVKAAAVLADALQDISVRLTALESGTPGTLQGRPEPGGQRDEARAAAIALAAVILDEAKKMTAGDESYDFFAHEERCQALYTKLCGLPAMGPVFETSRVARLQRDRAIAEVKEAWAALGTTAEEAAEDPDTANLADSVRISLEYERDKLKDLSDLTAGVERRRGDPLICSRWRPHRLQPIPGHCGVCEPCRLRKQLKELST